ncbi:MAG: choice-of-anchor D domain-containing protein [Polyangiales bacterium]
MTSRALPWALAASALLAPLAASAQTGACGEGFVDCASAPIAFRHRVGLPLEVDLDTGWVPAGLPVQARFRAALVGGTEVAMNGQLVAGWPTPMVLQAVGDEGGGRLALDYGVEVAARVRLNLDTGVGNASWEGAIPYVPMVNFRATAMTTFTPWAWSPAVAVRGSTARQRVADIRLTDAIVRIPGISGGFTIDIAAEIEATWQTRRITFGLDADPITEAMPRTQAVFSAGPFAAYSPRVEGEFAHTGTLHVYPSLYVSLLGRRWQLQIADIPIPLGPFRSPVTTDPSNARIELPDIAATVNELDFGEVPVGESAERVLPIANTGEGTGRIVSVEGFGPFAAPTRMGTLPPRSRAMLVIAFTPTATGVTEGEVVVNTSDPDSPRVRVRVRGVGLPGAAPADAGVTEDVPAAVDDVPVGDGGTEIVATDQGGCGCRAQTAPRASSAPLALLVGLAISLRRRRFHARRRRAAKGAR